MNKSSNFNISHMIDLISSSLIVILMKTLFHQSHYCVPQTYGLSLSNFIRLLLFIKVDRVYLDTHFAPIVDQLSPTYTIRSQVVKRSYFCVIKLQQPHCEQSCHHRSKDHSRNYNIEIITDN